MEENNPKSQDPIRILAFECYDADMNYKGIVIYLRGHLTADFSAKAGDPFNIGYTLTQFDIDHLTRLIADHPARVAKGKLEFIDGTWVDK